MAADTRRSSSASGGVTWTQLTADSASAAAAAPGAATTTAREAKTTAVGPSKRAGHAMTLLRPTESMLLYGGSNGDVFFEDFYVLEPDHYTALSDTQYSAASSNSSAVVEDDAGELDRSVSASQDEEESQRHPSVASSQADVATDARPAEALPSLQWKKLVVTYAPAHFSSHFSTENTYSSENHTSSMDSEDSNRESEPELPHIGVGRDYHTMHYVPTSSDEEREKGMRVLVVGNMLVGTAEGTTVFETEEFRIDEVRIRQPMLEAQWVTRRFTSMWKPRARVAHSSALVGDHIYCFGGRNTATTVFYNDMFYFDVRLHQWKKPVSTGNPPPPRAYASMAASRSRGQIFVYGGFDGRRQYGGMHMYDIVLGRWDNIVLHGEKPRPRMNHSLTYVAPDHLILFGGRDQVSRQNEVALFNIETKTWKRLSGGTSPATSSSASVQSESMQDASIAEDNTTEPVGRTAHSALVYRPRRKSQGAKQVALDERILIFGGYAGSRRWLNDLQLLTIPSTVLKQTRSLPSLNHTASQRSSSAASSKEEKARAASARVPLSQRKPSSSRSESGGSGGVVLSDITNQTAQSSSSSSVSLMASARASFPSSSKRPLKSTGLATTADTRGVHFSQSSQSAQMHKKRKRQSETPDNSSSSGELMSSQVGLETTMIQVLQCVDRLGTEIAKANSENFGQAQLQKRLDAEKKKSESLQRQLSLSNTEKHNLKEQLVAANTELYVYKRIHEEAPKANTEAIIRTMDQNRASEHDALVLIEDKLSTIFDVVNDMRHLSGDRTETEDSPHKGGSMFPDESDDARSPPSQPHMYPERVVVDLKEQLRVANATIEELKEELKTKEAKLKRAERHSERIRQLYLAWQDDDKAMSSP